MKTNSKKILSGILVLCMLMAWIPTNALAASVVSIINLTIEAPQAGNTPAKTATLPEKASTRVLSVSWSPADAVFKENTTYTVTIRIGMKPDQNKVFTSHVDKMSVKINGNKVKRVQSDGTTVTVKYGWILRSEQPSADQDKTKDETQNETKAETTSSGFSDVKDSAYYADAVKWAVGKKITAGTSATTFSPDNTCTRAQILTFLWRAVGSPKKSGAAFGDVTNSDYYYNAALWAKELDMVSGESFEPNTPCTRAFTVIYLWKNAGSPKTELTSSFTDVAPNAFYAQAVAWAVKNGVTSGTSATTFSPNDTCTRGQIVTFLKRADAVPKTSEKTDKDDTSDTDKKDDAADTKDDIKKDEDTKKDDTADKTEDTKQDTKPDTKTDDTKEDTKKDETKKDETAKDDGDDADANLPEQNGLNGAPSNKKTTYDKAVYEAAVQKALREALGDDLGEGMPDVMKALLLHDWLVEHCTYDLTYVNKYCHSEYGAIVNGIAVCDGYTKGYNDLLSRVGIPAVKVVGLADNGNGPALHAWSLVTIGGKQYHVDVTWDDPTPDIAGKIGRTYFLVSDSALDRHYSYSKHSSDKTYENGWLFVFNVLPFFRDESKNGFYYVDMGKVKFTTDLKGTLDSARTNADFSAIRTEDEKFICYAYSGGGLTSRYPMYLYSIETGEYYTYSGVKDIPNVIFCILRQNGNKVEVSRQYYDTKYSMPYGFGVKATIALPTSAESRHATFDPNYSGGKTASCDYLNAYWHKGDEPLQTLTRSGFAFGGWYTEKVGGVKIESLDDIEGDDATLYARWWNPWKITQAPTETEEGKAERFLDGYPDIKEEVILPVVTDTSVWKKGTEVSSTSTRPGWTRYSSEYGEIRVPKPLLPPEELQYGVKYKDGEVYITVLEEATFPVVYESVEDGEVVSSGTRFVTTNGPGELRVLTPKNFIPSGTVRVTLYDSDMNALASTEYQAE